MAGELFKMMTGIDMIHVPYRGGAPALTDLIGGQVQVYFSPCPTVDRAHQERQGACAGGDDREAFGGIARTCRPLASSCQATRQARGTASARPKNTPAEIVEKLNKEINAALADPKIKARLADLGGSVPMPMSPADFGKFIADETEKWGKVIRAANIKPE